MRSPDGGIAQKPEKGRFFGMLGDNFSEGIRHRISHGSFRNQVAPEVADTFLVFCRLITLEKLLKNRSGRERLELSVGVELATVNPRGSFKFVTEWYK